MHDIPRLLPAAAIALLVMSGCNRRQPETPTPASTPEPGLAVPSTVPAPAPGGMGSAPGDSGAIERPLSATEQSFVRAATESNLYEIAMGKLAAEKAQDPSVKAFGNTLAEDHRSANDQLRDLVGTRATLPSAVGTDKQADIDRLSKATGSDFDRQFIQTVGLKAHQADIATFENTRGELLDTRLQDFVDATLPVLRRHLTTAQDLAKSLGIPAS